jgi:hypothetical protein
LGVFLSRFIAGTGWVRAEDAAEVPAAYSVPLQINKLVVGLHCETMMWLWASSLTPAPGTGLLLQARKLLFFFKPESFGLWEIELGTRV